MLSNNHNQLKSKKVEKNGSIILPSLSLPQDDDTELDQESLTAIIQCGHVKFQVTRVPLNFCISRVSQAEKKKIVTLAPSLGARVTTLVHKSSTHLITAERTCTAKAISAWALSIPMCTPSFVEALSDRKGVDCPLPCVESYLAEGDLKVTEPENASGEPNSILKNYTILSLMESEAEMMCTCAGATIKKLYLTEMKSWQQDDFFDNLVKENEDKGSILCWLDCTSRKVKKGKSYLQKKMKMAKETGFGLRCISQKGIAKAISSLVSLSDVDGIELKIERTNHVQLETSNDLQTINDVKCDEKKSMNVNNDNIEQQVNQKSLSSKNLNTISEDNEIIDEIMSNNDSPKLQEKNSNENKEILSHSKKLGESTPEQNENNFNFSEQSQPKDKQNDNGSGWISVSQKRPKKNEWVSRSKPPNKKRNRGEESQSSAGCWMSSHKSRSQRREVSDNNIYQPGLEELEDIDKISNEGKKKMSLPAAKDGWLVAPKGKARSKYMRKVTEIVNDQEVIVESAQTETCNLVVSKSKPVNQISNVSNNNITTKDFKRFRKNSIIPGARMHSITQIQFVSLLPKESERQKALELSQIELDREQSAADELFADNTGRKKQGIRAFLTPSSRSSRRRG